MKLKTRFYIVICVVLFGFGSIAGLSTFFSYKINRLKKADTICFDTLVTLKHLQVLNAELLYSVELDKTWGNWRIYHNKLQLAIKDLNESPYIHELLVTPKQKGLLQSLSLFWFSTREKLTEVEHSMATLFTKKDFSRDGLIQQYYSTKNFELLGIRNHIMAGSLYLKSEFEVKLDKLVKIIEEETQRQFFNTLVLVAIISSAIAIIVSITLISFLAKLKGYLAQLHHSMEKIGKGDFTQKLTAYGNDELSEISMSINMTTHSLGRIHQELQERIKEAEAANTSKSLFLANMSHELRTPLNTILGFSKILGQETNLDDEQRKNLSIISRNGQHLLSLINDILTISKIEAGGLFLNEKKVDLYDLLDDINEMFRIKATQKELKFILTRAVELPRYVITDEVKLRQILINLIQNSLKFTPQGHVSLSVYPRQSALTDSHQKVIQFEITDTGIGIDKDNHDQIFEVFAQIDPSRERQEGAGLGLPLSRQYVELMNGQLTVESEKGKGATFSFDIPLKVSGSTVVNIENKYIKMTGIHEEHIGKRILIVDDKWDSRRLLVQLLSPLGFKLKEAQNGDEAISIWRHFKPDLVFMDIQMPVLDGLVATKRIIEEDKDKKTVIIAVSANVFEDKKASYFKAGCSDFISKPFESFDVFGILEKHLGVEFLYNGQSISRQEPSVTPEVKDTLPENAFKDIPEYILEALEHSVIRAEMDNIFDAIKEMEKYNSSLASTFSRLANDFAYDRIKTLLENRKTNGI